MNEHDEARPARAAEPRPGPGGQGIEVDSWIAEHLPALRAFVRVRLGPAVAARESSADIVQSVCRELLEDAPRLDYQGQEALRGWLFTAAAHKIQQKARFHGAQKRDVKREAMLPDRAEGDEAGGLLDAYAHLATPSRELDAREQIARIESALAGLSEGEREIIGLARLAGLGHAEIATRLGITEENSRARLRRALVKLAARLEPGG